MSIKIDQLIAAISETESNGVLKKLDPEILSGLSGDKIIGTLQRLCCLFAAEKDTCYLEIGVFQGLTLLSTALSCPDIKCYGIDNFAQFDPKKENYSIIKERQNKLSIKNIELINEDYEDALEKLPKYIGKSKVGVYFVDGPHDYRSQLMCLELILPYLHENAVIVVDDCNYQHVRQANRDFLVTHPEYKLLFDAYTRCHPNHMSSEENYSVRKGWWNGINVLVRDIKNDLKFMLPPTERSRDIFENEHKIHPHFLAKLAPELLNITYMMYDCHLKGIDIQADNRIKEFFKKMDSLSNSYSILGYKLYKQMNTFSQNLLTRFNRDEERQMYHQKYISYFQEGIKYFKEGRLKEAEIAYRKVTQFNQNSALPYYNLAEILTKKGKIDEAIAAYRKAIELKPRTASFNYKLADALVQKGSLEEAIKHYQKASELNPEFPLFQRKLAEIIKLHQEVSERPTSK
ncbi:class I SAM-dependent methyltransferase [Lyngbya sp. PCC 8106]|uniref:class I SAM-dependent methyltransferase n=1 Tax=Lyngbya sp. (strain PCC 8106) TaxID=313612 RepID=UPI0000EABCBB|nr:tetratricopeptide repeat protein [Lyngbya sp. PCC 8106]EAW35612.1 hypothetical protein L8106_13415 [Lyngbya sp. PCC 8106]